jgi:hypothetical protein
MILFIFICLLVLAILVFVLLWILARRKAAFWEEEYNMLDVGMSEQEDNYEQQFISFEEKIRDLVASEAELQAMVDVHRDECLSVHAIEMHQEHNSG